MEFLSYYSENATNISRIILKIISRPIFCHSELLRDYGIKSTDFSVD
jgi:hypothetical protein